MFRKKYYKRSSNPLFVIFRLLLSLIMFSLLLGGAYTAYKHFSGLDPLKLDLQSVLKSLIEAKTPQQVLAVLKFDKKIIPAFPGQSDNKQVLGQSKYIFRFLLVADSHNDNTNLKKALSQAKTKYPDLVFVIGLGDYTDVGTIQELQNAKFELDSSGLRYFLIPGDHDLWDSRNRNLSPDADFKQVFGPTYQSFTYSNFRFLLLDNSDNYSGISTEQQKWITNELEKVKDDQVKGILVFTHEPLYHPSSDHFMGRVEKQLKQQAKSLIFQLKEANVKKVFAGDIHYFSEYEEPEAKLSMVTVGALVTERNPQTPRFAVGYVFENDSIKIEDVEIR